MSRSHTKKGPGRWHGQGALATVELKPGHIVHVVNWSQRKFPIARVGGNWKGQEYFTQPEIDRCVREALAMASTHLGKLVVKHDCQQRIIEARNVS